MEPLDFAFKAKISNKNGSDFADQEVSPEGLCRFIINSKSSGAPAGYVNGQEFMLVTSDD